MTIHKSMFSPCRTLKLQHRLKRRVRRVACRSLAMQCIIEHGRRLARGLRTLLCGDIQGTA